MSDLMAKSSLEEAAYDLGDVAVQIHLLEERVAYLEKTYNMLDERLDPITKSPSVQPTLGPENGLAPDSPNLVPLAMTIYDLNCRLGILGDRFNDLRVRCSL